MDDNDAQLHIKKRARRRLVGAIFFVSVVAVVLPMVMDHEPRQTVQDVEIRIPGQDEKPFAPKFAAAPVERAAAKPTVTSMPSTSPVRPTRPASRASTTPTSSSPSTSTRPSRTRPSPLASSRSPRMPGRQKSPLKSQW